MSEYIPAIYVIITLAYALTFYFAYREDNILSILSSFLLFVLSIYIFVNGIDDLNNFVTIMFGAVTLGIGIYVSSVGAMNLFKENL